MSTIQVDVVSAEEEVFSGLAEFVALPGETGELGILPGHTPLITRIRPGAVRMARMKSLFSLPVVFWRFSRIM